MRVLSFLAALALIVYAAITGQVRRGTNPRQPNWLTGPVGGWRRPDGYVVPMPRRPG